MKHQKTIKTAYSSDSSYEYDKRRFTTPHGKLFHTLEVEQLKRVLGNLPIPSNVLEVGCGTGRFIEITLAAGHKVHGIDPSPYMLDVARKRCRRFKDVKFYLAEGAALPYADQMFDLLYSIRTINQTSSREYAFKMIKEMIRVTKLGGMLLIEFCNSWRPHSIKKSKAVRLSILDICRIVKKNPSLRLIRTGGILIFSMTVLNHIPYFLLPLVGNIDRLCSSVFPQFASRCYVTLGKKTS